MHFDHSPCIVQEAFLGEDEGITLARDNEIDGLKEALRSELEGRGIDQGR